MKLTHVIGCCLFVFISPVLSAQEIATDNKGEAIFTIPTADPVNTEIALKNIGVKFRPFRFNKKTFFVKEGGKEYFTMDKSTVINLGASLYDNDDDVFTIAKDANLTPHIEIGISRGIDALINPSKINKYYTLSGSLFADFQQFDLYDTVNKTFLPKYNRTSYGGNIGLNIFFKTCYAFAFNLSYKNSIETDDQVSYQKKASNTIYTDNNILSNGEDDGYLSPLTPKKNWRMSLAVPWFLKTKRAFSIIPYYFINFGKGISPKNNAGVMFTVLNDKFRDFDKDNPADRDKGKTYTFETAFSVGLNLISTGSDKHSFIFLSGTITFGSSKTPDDKKEKNKNTF